MAEFLSAKVRVGTAKKNAKVHAIAKLTGRFSAEMKAAIQDICDGMGPQIDAILNPPKQKASDTGGTDE